LIGRQQSKPAKGGPEKEKHYKRRKERKYEKEIGSTRMGSSQKKKEERDALTIFRQVRNTLLARKGKRGS